MCSSVLAADKERTKAESIKEGEKAGLEMIKHHSTLAHQRDMASKQAEKQKGQPKKGK